MTASLRLAEPLDPSDRSTGSAVPILIVDDSAAKRTALKSVLLPLGYSIVEADSGSAALRCVMAEDFAVILLDVRMPIMDGFETAAHIRMRRQSEMTPIIFITAHGSDEIVNSDLYAQGAVDFIFSPVPPNELRAKVSVFANLFSRAEDLASKSREVQATADQLRLLTDAAPIGIFHTDRENKFIYTNPRWSEITGIPREEAAGQQWAAIIGSKERVGLVTELADSHASSSELSHRFEIRFPEAASRIVLVTSRSVPDSDGGIAGWVGTLADVTAESHEREADLARRKAEERYRRIIETTMEGIWLIDAENRTLFVNEALAAMLGTTVGEMQGRLSLDFCCDEAGLSHTTAALDRRRDGVNEQHEMRLRRADGSEMHALVSASSFLDEGGEYGGSLSMIRDVTERVQQEELRHGLEEQLRHSQRLESIGHLAGGIAHDFNNLLLAIRGYGELALLRIERGEDTAGTHIKDMLEAAERATKLTGQLLAFGRRQVLKPKVIDLREVVGEMEKTLHQMIGDRIELVTTLPNAPVLVEADRTQLEQVIANLAVNARDAMPDGGSVVITVRLSADKSPEAVLSVADNGSGMDAETAARVFEPFFSTKGAAGSGFGLATVHGIVSQSGGRIALVSTPGGGGSTFSIFLPLSHGAQTPAAIPRAQSAGGADTILVVEDDAMVRRLVATMLEDRGYRVLAASSGHAAMEVAKTWDSEISVILTDLVMPGSGGRETAAQIRPLFPRAKIIYMSGYTDDNVIRDGDAFEPGIAFIQKPFGADQLAHLVRQVLEEELG